MPATPSPRPHFDPQELPWGVLSSACAQGDVQPLETLWSHFKRPEQARAAAVRAVFTGACARGDTKLAAWVRGLYPQHIDVSTLKSAATQSIKNAAHKTWQFMTDVIDAHPSAAHIYGGLLRDAAQYGTPAVLQKLAPHMGDMASSHLYAAVVGDNMPALMWLTDHCKKENKLSAAHLDQALLVSVQRGHTPMASWLLGAGADAAAHDDAALRHALPHTPADGGVLMELLVRAGAHPQKAQEMLAAQTETQILTAKIKQAAEETAQHHLAQVKHLCGDPPAPSSFADRHAALGTTAIHYAAHHRILHRLPVQSFAAADLAQKNARGENVIDVLVRRDEAAPFFTPDRWRGQTEKLAAALDLLSDTHPLTQKREAILRSAEQQSLQHIAQQAGAAFRLGPRPRR